MLSSPLAMLALATKEAQQFMVSRPGVSPEEIIDHLADKGIPPHMAAEAVKQAGVAHTLRGGS